MDRVHDSGNNNQLKILINVNVDNTFIYFFQHLINKYSSFQLDLGAGLIFKNIIRPN